MKKRKGFTLVELLAVIVVLAIILVLALPNVLNQLDKAKIKSFKVYSDRVLESAEKKLMTDYLKENDELINIYEIGPEIGLTDTGDYEGYVVVNNCGKKKEFRVFMWNDDYELLDHVLSDNMEPIEKDNNDIAKAISRIENNLTNCHSFEIYGIDLNFNGGDPISTNNVKVNGNHSIDLPTPTRDGYTFVGWYDSDNKKYNNGDIYSDYDLSNLTAKWCRTCVNEPNGTCNMTPTSIGECTYQTSCRVGYTIGNNGAYNVTCTPNTYTLTLTKGTGIDKLCYKVNGAADYTCVTSSTNVDVIYETAFSIYVTPASGYTNKGYTEANPYTGIVPLNGFSYSPTAYLTVVDATPVCSGGTSLSGANCVKYEANSSVCGSTPYQCNGYQCNPYQCNPTQCNPYQCNGHSQSYSCTKTKNFTTSGSSRGSDPCAQSCYGKSNCTCSCSQGTCDRTGNCPLSCSGSYTYTDTCSRTVYDTCYDTCYSTCYNTCYNTCYSSNSCNVTHNEYRSYTCPSGYSNPDTNLKCTIL